MSELSAPYDDKQGEYIAATPMPGAQTTQPPQRPGDHGKTDLHLFCPSQ